MRVYLIRHAKAFERDARRWPDDRLRPLTPEGMKKFRKSAAGLAQLVEPVSCLLTSPLVRARQTAEILTAIARWPHAAHLAVLAPEHAPGEVLEALREHAGEALALVGHEPGLSRLLAASIVGMGARVPCELKKGGAACLDFPSALGAGRARLEWLITPRALRAIG